jgi:ABC-type polar amino acid transport system ATPase subunit
MLKVQKLTKTFKDKTILNELDFEIDHGNIAIFLGGSGVGKSTLLRILNNLEDYDEGCFILDDQSLDLKTVNRNHTVGMVFQHFNLFEHLSVEDNIILPLMKCQNKTKAEAVKISSDLLGHYGIRDKATVKSSQLSGGQKQRLAIARTLALNPKIICLDEPTSALDPKLTGQVAVFINELARENRIVLLTTHDVSLIEQLEAQLFLMEGGKIVESASKKACFADGGQYPKLQGFLKGL